MMRGIGNIRLWGVVVAAFLQGCANEAARPASASAAGCGAVDNGIEPVTPQAKQIDALLGRYAQYGFSGSALVRQNGQPALSRGYGWAAAEKDALNGAGTLFDVASLAKSFTAAAILDLEARGKLSTADPLSKHLPGLATDKRAITLHHLLTHTSGYPLDAADIGMTADDSEEEVLGRAASARLLSAPGASYNYSNVGYGLLAQVVERVSGRKWQSYVRERLLRRARLRNTFLFGETPPSAMQLAQGYSGPSEEEAALQPPMVQTGRNRLLWGKHPLGSVGVFATVGDLDKWWCALNGPKLLPLAQRSKLFTAQAPNQGYGWNILEAEGRVTRIHRGGLRGSYQSLVAYYPERRDLLVYGINKNVNVMWASLVWGNVERLLRGEPVALPPELGAVDEAALASRGGEYRLATGGRLVFRKSGRVLFFGAEGQDALDPLEYEGRQKPEAGERLEAGSVDLVRALGAGKVDDARRLANTSPDNLAKLLDQWRKWDRQIGGWREAELLGSTPGSEKYLRTFLRLRGGQGQLVIRLLWDPAKGSLLAWGEDIPLPAYVRLWPQSETDFVSHDLLTGRTRYFRFNQDAVTVESGDGKILARGRRAR